MPLPVITVSQMREWEKATWETGVTEAEVIRRVGEIVGQRARELTKPGDLILILAGKGHNGDDARCAREHLRDRRAEILDVANPEESFSKLDALLSLKPALIIDGLFGIGINRALDEHWLEFIERINASNAPVLAVDTPSGLNADTGDVHGAAIRATITLTLGAPKVGLIRTKAAPFVGKLEVASQIGLVPCPLKTDLQWTTASDFENYPPRRNVASHKGNFGHLAIIAGSFGFHGAAVLAARGAQRARPGLITVFTVEQIYHAIASQLQAVMVSLWNPKLDFSEKFSALLIGPGLASGNLPKEMAANLRKLWHDSPLPIIVDAGALGWLPLDSAPKPALRLITPHPGEAARLLKSTSDDVQADRCAALEKLSQQFGESFVALKGHQTLVGKSGGDVYVNSSGTVHLAQGGSGDLLAGYLAGLLAQPELQADPMKAIRYGVWQHGASADLLDQSKCNWIVEDLAATLGMASPQGDA
jgi:ADP-dependent NAD(P)H-hydrate dehydratase / NAD(P)H-hydrate epimerase